MDYPATSPRTASFDVFDTLLTRIWAEPRDLFVRLGERLSEAGLSKRDAGDFACERSDAEAAARSRTASREITMDDIYRELGARMRWTDSQGHAAMAAEIGLESEGIRIVPGAREQVDGARSKSGRIVFLSDMYLPSQVIRGWLESSALFRPGDLVMVSGEAGGGKGNGALFAMARERTASDFASWSHVGDNLHSDGEAPGRLGIASRLEQRAHLAPRERVLRGNERFAKPWRSLLAGAARLARISRRFDGPNDRDEGLWGVGTSVAGPLFWSYTEWCLREAEKRGIGDLFFLARGGQVFFRIAQAVQARRPVPIRLHYLHTSRLAFAGIADSADLVSVRKLVSAPLAFHSFQQALANVGIDPETDLSPPGLPRGEWGRNLKRGERDAVADWLLSPAQLPRIQAALAERRRLAQAYLRQSGLHAAGRIGLVDTGWMGTIQRNIEFLLGAPSAPTRITGFYLGLSEVRDFTCAGEMLAYTNTFAPLPLRRETTHLILLELMAQGTHGPLLGFSEEKGALSPRLGAIGAGTLSETRLFQDAVLAFVGCVQDSQECGRVPERELARAVIGAYREFFRHPTLREALLLGRMPHANQMLEESHTQLCPDMTSREIVRAMLDFHSRPPGWWLYGQAAQGNSALIQGYLALKRLKWWVQGALTGRPD
jgi:predicted HAD superfamily hydrolase